MKLLKKIWNWLTEPTSLREVAETSVRRASEAIEIADRATKYANLLEAQLVQVRVSQSRIGRAGWEVMCFIPEEVLNQFGPDRSDRNNPCLDRLIFEVTHKLTTAALAGINRVNAEGKVCALIFAPLFLRSPADEPRYVQAVFDKDGKYKVHEKLWDGRSQEQRVNNACGLGLTV